MIEEDDLHWLKERGSGCELTTEGSIVNLVLADFTLPSGFDTEHVDLLLRLPVDFPDIKPDMFWVSPHIKLANGTLAPASSHSETHLGRTWQRFSRHLAPSQWRPGTDDLRTWVTMIEQMLRRDGAT